MSRISQHQRTGTLLSQALLACLLLAAEATAGSSPRRQRCNGVPKKQRTITIATLGCAPLSVAADTDPQQIVDRMIAHWKGKFARVLPDKPDLIVVPEACDRPSGFSHEQQGRYYPSSRRWPGRTVATSSIRRTA